MDVAAGGRGLELLLLHEINAGTFARLYLAEVRGSGGLDRIVAVKILREQWNEQQDIVNRTRDEARLLGRLRHKNILRVEDLVEVDGQTAIIMEYVDGLDLKQLVDALRDRRQRVPAKVALQMTLESASALEAAYFRVPTGLDGPLRVVHRDLKPSNIMLSVEGEVRVLDFGTARSSHIFRSAETGAMRFGSLKYMSPERREGDRGEHAGDIYALGLVLLELLRTEWMPLLPMDVGEHDEAIAQAIARLDHLGMPNSEWDMTLRQVLGQMLASEPSVRPTADQLVKLLRAFVEQCSGPVLDRFAHEVVQPLAQELNADRSGGALAGRRLIVNPLDSGRPSGPRPAPSRPPEGSAVSPPKPAAAPAGRSTLPPEPRPTPRHAPPPEPEAEGGGSGAAIALGAGLFVLIGIGVVALGLGGAAIWYSMNSPGSATVEVVPPGDDKPAGDVGGAGSASGGGAAGTGTSGGGTAEVPAPTGAPVRVEIEGAAAQWVRLESGGASVVEGKKLLDSRAPSGDYELVVKLVGRAPLRGALAVPDDGVSLRCAEDTRSNLKCAGGKRTLTLKP